MLGASGFLYRHRATCFQHQKDSRGCGELASPRVFLVLGARGPVASWLPPSKTCNTMCSHKYHSVFYAYTIMCLRIYNIICLRIYLMCVHIYHNVFTHIQCVYTYSIHQSIKDNPESLSGAGSEWLPLPTLR